MIALEIIGFILSVLVSIGLITIIIIVRTDNKAKQKDNKEVIEYFNAKKKWCKCETTN